MTIMTKMSSRESESDFSEVSQTLNKILFTGLPGSGKTTLISRIVQQLRIPLTGFFTREIREEGKRVGFSINTLDGKQAILAHINVSGQYRVGRYGVVLENIESVAVTSMIPKGPQESVVIDEIGKMECLSSLFRKTLLDILDMPNTVIGTISLEGDRFIRRIKGRNDVWVIGISKRNRDELSSTYGRLLSQLPPLCHRAKRLSAGAIK
jgi:nucleoside-triphosphatase THEP1